MKDFKPQKMVGWFDIRQLASTAIRAVLSSIFGSYADKRETIASITKPEVYDDYGTEREIWLDYISDTGDGFNSTFTMAKLISADQIHVNLNGKDVVLPRGKVAIFGGDQVYPTPTRQIYQDRFIGPLGAAAPKVEGGKEVDMFVVPGNHDWYDGLTNYIKIFCRKLSIGSFRTRQNRSYFAIKLSHNTWLWAIDIQLESDIDKPQLDYFDLVAKSHMQKGDKIILCTAEPSWIYHTSKRIDSTYINLEYFEKDHIAEKGFEQILTLAGDLHHYARYEDVSNSGKVKYKITAGGGGAFLHPTHNLPYKLNTMHDGEYELRKTFPSQKKSFWMTFGNLLFPLKNLSFGFFLAFIHLYLAWSIRISSSLDQDPGDILVQIRTMGLADIHLVNQRLINSFINSFSAVTVLLLFAFGFYKFCDTNSSKLRFVGITGFIHGLLHIALMLISLWAFTYISYQVLESMNMVYDITIIMSVVFLAVVIGGFVSGLLVGIYLIFCNLVLGIHDNEAFSSMKIEGHKNFLRMHIRDNKLTIYPIGIRKIAKWKADLGNFITKDQISPELIESPIVIDLN